MSGAPCLTVDAVPCGLTVDCWTPAWAAIRFLTVSMPSKSIILMNGVKHRVELGVYYGYVPGWFLKFTEL